MPRILLAVLVLLALAACSSKSLPAPTPPATALQSTTAIPGLTVNGVFTYDIGAVDATAHRYYLADRTNKALDVLNSDTGAFIAQIPGNFAGQFADNNQSGPDGVVVIPGQNTVYVGDVNSVKVINPATRSIVTTIPITTSGFRTDEGCYDPVDGLVVMANPGDAPPFDSVISVKTNTVIGTLKFPGSAGLEACVYDPGTKNFFLNNDGTPANPQGELDVVSAASAAVGAPVVSAVYPEAGCSPTGLALGANEVLMVGCDPPASQIITLFFNAKNGSLLKTLTSTGGADEVDYNPTNQRFYLANRHWTATGMGSATGPYTPTLGIVDATTLDFIANLPTGNNAHSVAADPNTGNVFVPVPPTATTAGGINIYR
jgi:hypothetical protein